MADSLRVDSLPRQTWRILGLTAVLLLVVTVTAIGFISAGAFDPKPVGSLAAELPLQSVSVPAETQRLQWLDYDLATADFSLRLTAAYESGALDSGYGVALGDEGSVLVAAVSPLGYAAVMAVERPFSQSIGDEDGFGNLDGMLANGPGGAEVLQWPIGGTAEAEKALFEWQTWPHVHEGQETNEIWLDKRGEVVTVRINREILWAGDVSILPTQVGLWLGSFNQPTTIRFESLTVFSE